MRVDFYHLEHISLDEALPKILEKAHATQEHVLLKVEMAERADHFNTLLWEYTPDSFLPHGVEKDGFADKQPIFITHKDHYNPNGASICVVVDNMPIPLDEGFTRCLYFFDGRNPVSLEKAREEWKKIKSQNLDCFYWQQDEAGHWQNRG